MKKLTCVKDALLPLLVSTACLAAGCEQIRLGITGEGGAGGQPLGVWAASDMVGLTDRTKEVQDERLFDARRKTISLFAAANETLSFQVVVDPGPAGARDVRLAWSALSGPGRAAIPAERIRAFRMLPLRITEYPPWYLRLVEEVPAPAGTYDPLVPVDTSADGHSLNIDPNGRLALWMDLAVPRDAAAGDYSGTLRISAAGREQWTATLRLEVYSFVLPDARPVPAVGAFDHRELFGAFLTRDGKPFDPVYLDRRNPLVRRGLVLIRRLMRLAHDHRLDLFDTQVRPIMKRTGDGKLELQWQDYDAVVMPYLDGTAFDDRIGCAAWPVPLSEDWPEPEHYAGRSAQTYEKAVAALLAACRDHFAGNVQVRERMFIWPCRRAAGPEAYKRYAQLAAIARRVDPNTPILCRLPLSAPPGSPWLVPGDLRRLVDILAPPGDMLDPTVAASAVRPEHPLAGVWLAPAIPPYLPSLGVIARPADVRAMAWFGMKYGCTGLFLPDVLHWSTDPFAPIAGSETRLFYPGRIAGIEEPLPSVRLKRLRRGLQDIAYLWILRKRQRAGVARAMMNSLVRYAGLAATGDNYLDPRLDGWVDDGGTWVLARRILAEEVQAVVSPERAPRTRTLAHRLSWRKLEEQTRALKVEQVRSLVGPAAGSRTDPPEKLNVTILLDLFNQHGREADVRAELAELPRGWRASAAGLTMKIPPASRRVVRLEAVGPGPPPTKGNARMPVLIRLASNVEADRTIVASVGLLMVGRMNKPPKIDGLLDDWPLRAGNTARDFRLIGRRGRKGDGLAKRQTMAFVLRDEAKLYIAFRCEEPNLPGMVKRPSNSVRYEQLMAAGEDMVEMLFDPGGRASGPEDLYHLIVKPNGVLISERGVGCDPPLGRVRPWATFASLAIADRPGAWTVELAVPLAAFGDGAKEAIWRVNFTRYSTQGAEASSWSGAPRYFYDPRNLGTMFVGPAATGGE
ncbi:MAG: hypothetical protein WBF17_04310 [Phycisphaerae bacterium]